MKNKHGQRVIAIPFFTLKYGDFDFMEVMKLIGFLGFVCYISGRSKEECGGGSYLEDKANVNEEYKEAFRTKSYKEMWTEFKGSWKRPASIHFLHRLRPLIIIRIFLSTLFNQSKKHWTRWGA
ncbi:hypothetical protein V6N13_139138 [Hibiscus sabdariffa]